MHLNYLTKRLGHLRTSIKTLRGNSDGVAAVEFAMIVPIMFVLFVGALEFGTALTIDRRTSQIASSSADLVSRADRVSTAELQFITQQIATSMMSPYSATPLNIAIISVKAAIDDETNTTVDWSYSTPGAATYNQGDTFPIPTGLMSKGTSVIVGEAKYAYQPFIFQKSATSINGQPGVTPGAYTMREIFYLSPRTKSCVSLDNINCVTGTAF